MCNAPSARGVNESCFLVMTERRDRGRRTGSEVATGFPPWLSVRATLGFREQAPCLAGLRSQVREREGCRFPAPGLGPERPGCPLSVAPNPCIVHENLSRSILAETMAWTNQKTPCEPYVVPSPMMSEAASPRLPGHPSCVASPNKLDNPLQPSCLPSGKVSSIDVALSNAFLPKSREKKTPLPKPRVTEDLPLHCRRP